jgi:hypothetical protein
VLRAGYIRLQLRHASDASLPGGEASPGGKRFWTIRSGFPNIPRPAAPVGAAHRCLSICARIGGNGSDHPRCGNDARSAVFRGTRVPVQTLFEYLEGGETLDDFIEGFPTVSRELALAGLEEARLLLMARAS